MIFLMCVLAIKVEKIIPIYVILSVTYRNDSLIPNLWRIDFSIKIASLWEFSSFLHPIKDAEQAIKNIEKSHNPKEY